MYRQGDVLVVRVAAIPAATRVVAREEGRVILARGESTGHHHSIVEDAATLLIEQAGAVAGRRWLEIAGDAPVALTHQEHATIMLAPGIYEIRQQREYSPEAIRYVAD